MARTSTKLVQKLPASRYSALRLSQNGLLYCFFLSGSAALIYQVLWTKALGLVFGHTAYALSTVLAVFMAGLAAGSAWLGRWGETRPEPLKTYAWLELGVGASGAISLTGIGAVRIVYHSLASDSSSSMLLVAFRFFGAFAVLFLPTFLMGGTLPILVRALKRRSPELGQRFARLYWVNSAGAVVGTLAAGFIFLPVLGMRSTLGIAVAINVFAGLIALRLARRPSPEEPANSVGSQQANRKTAGSAVARHATFASGKLGRAASQPILPAPVLLICFAIVGATAMAYEIGWTRLLATQIGSSTYAFTVMLATFLTGIALGSALFERWSGRPSTQMTFAWTQLFIAAAALSALIFFNSLPDVLASMLSANNSFRMVLLAQLAVSALAIFPTAVFFGFNFPVVTLLTAGAEKTIARPPQEAAEIPKQGESALVGRAYAWNTIGAIAGAIMAGFWLLPKLGSFHLLAATAAMNVLLAALLAIACIPSRSPGRSRSRTSALVGLGCSVLLLAVAGAVAFTNQFYDPAVATFNTLLYWNGTATPTGLPIRQKARMVDVVYWEDGLNATISVARTDNILALRTNGKTDASNSDVDTQLMLGHIGAVAHPPLRRVLVIGFGAGMTLSALVRYPGIEELDCVEIEPAVLRAAPLLRSLNRGVLNDKRVHIIYDDGRNFLSTTRNRYDLIVSEPSNPWIDGVASLFTREFYRSAEERLAPGGIFVQWLQAYSLYPDDLRMVCATFLSAFHHASLWHGVKSDLLLVAHAPSSGQMLDNMQTLWSNSTLRYDFQWMGIERPEGLFGFYLLDDSGLQKFAAGGQVDTDDRTLLEYRAPRSLLVSGLEDENLRQIYAAQPQVELPGISGEQRNAVLAASAVTALNAGDIPGADRLVSAFSGNQQTADEDIARGRDRLAHSDYDAAALAFNSALAADPASVSAAWGLAEVNRNSGKLDLAEQQLLHILDRAPNDSRTLASLEQLYSQSSHSLEAAEIQRRFIQASPRPSADDYAELGEMYKRGRKLEEALAAMKACLALDPYNFQTNLNMGQIFDVERNYPEARKHLELVERFFPDANPQTYALLYEVDNALGDSQAAKAAVRFGIHLFPNDPDLLRLTESSGAQ